MIDLNQKLKTYNEAAQHAMNVNSGDPRSDGEYHRQPEAWMEACVTLSKAKQALSGALRDVYAHLDCSNAPIPGVL